MLSVDSAHFRGRLRSECFPINPVRYDVALTAEVGQLFRAFQISRGSDDNRRRSTHGLAHKRLNYSSQMASSQSIGVMRDDQFPLVPAHQVGLRGQRIWEM